MSKGYAPLSHLLWSTDWQSVFYHSLRSLETILRPRRDVARAGPEQRSSIRYARDRRSLLRLRCSGAHLLSAHFQIPRQIRGSVCRVRRIPIIVISVMYFTRLFPSYKPLSEILLWFHVLFLHLGAWRAIGWDAGYCVHPIADSWLRFPAKSNKACHPSRVSELVPD